MQSCLFNLHSIVDVERTTPFAFIVSPAGNNEQQTKMAEEAARILNANWEQAQSSLTVAEASDPEQADLLLADAFALLDEHYPEASDFFGISDVIHIKSDLVLVMAFLEDGTNVDAGDLPADDSDDNWD